MDTTVARGGRSLPITHPEWMVAFWLAPQAVRPPLQQWEAQTHVPPSKGRGDPRFGFRLKESLKGPSPISPALFFLCSPLLHGCLPAAREGKPVIVVPRNKGHLNAFHTFSWVILSLVVSESSILAGSKSNTYKTLFGMIFIYSYYICQHSKEIKLFSY